MRLLVFCFAFLVTPLIHSAPMPVTSSSEFIKSELGLFRSDRGFSIHAGKTSWKHISPPEDNPYIATMYRGPIATDGVQPTLTIRTDKAKKGISVKTYARAWMKDYPRFGFEIVTAKPVKVNGDIAFMVDLKAATSNRRLRQVLMKKDNRVVIMTCRDHEKTFYKNVAHCNQIVRNFIWL